MTFVMSAVLICKWTLNHYDDDDDDDDEIGQLFCKGEYKEKERRGRFRKNNVRGVHISCCIIFTRRHLRPPW